MYAKLIFRNAKRSAKDYLIYIVTLTICVTLFYAFLSISSSYYQPDIGTAYEITAFSDGIKLAVCAITLLLLFLMKHFCTLAEPACSFWWVFTSCIARFRFCCTDLQNKICAISTKKKICSSWGRLGGASILLAGQWLWWRFF